MGLSMLLCSSMASWPALRFSQLKLISLRILFYHSRAMG